MTQTIIQKFKVDFSYPVHFCRDIFNCNNPLLLQTLLSSTSQKSKVIIFVDDGLAIAQPQLINNINKYFQHYCKQLNLLIQPQITVGGERQKNNTESFKQILKILKTVNPCRHSFVIAIGGGSMLDSVGLATSLVHRGLRLVRLPSTVLAQNDAGVGVKNGIDLDNYKNFLGTFAPPFAVINDFDFLHSLPLSYWSGGLAEAFKVAIIKDSSFFKLLETFAPLLKARDENSIEKVIIKCAQIHLNHIATNGDPFEFGSARPLDFGHWAAHKLESLSQYSLNHGQSVAIGIALDVRYAHYKNMIGLSECKHILQTMQNCGLVLNSSFLHKKDKNKKLEILKGLEEFRTHLGGKLNITLPTSIGSSQEIHQMDFELIAHIINTHF